MSGVHHYYPGAARNFIEAYANTNYGRPLKGKDMAYFYVNRGSHSELKALMGELEAGARTPFPNNTKFLFVGHTGCGKSTELSCLVNIIETGVGARTDFLQKNFLPIQYSVSEVVGLYNIEFVNETFDDIELDVRVESPSSATLEKADGKQVVVKAEGIVKNVLFIKIPANQVLSARTVIRLGIYQNNEKIETVKVKFIGPVTQSSDVRGRMEEE